MVSKRNSVNCCRDHFQKKKLLTFNLFILCAHTCHRDHFQESVLPFQHVCPRDEIQVLGLSGRGFRQLSHPNGPDIYFQGIYLSVLHISISKI